MENSDKTLFKNIYYKTKSSNLKRYTFWNERNTEELILFLIWYYDKRVKREGVQFP